MILAEMGEAKMKLFALGVLFALLGAFGVVGDVRAQDTYCNPAKLAIYYRDGFDTCLYGRVVSSGYNSPWSFIQLADTNDVVIALYNVDLSYRVGECVAAQGEMYLTPDTYFIIAWERADVFDCTPAQVREVSPPINTLKPVVTGCPNGCSSPPAGCNIKGNIGYNTGEKIYHMPGDTYYSATVISPAYGERWFCTESEARANGWRRTYQ